MVQICQTVQWKAVNANLALSEAAQQFRLPLEAFIFALIIPFCGSAHLKMGTEKISHTCRAQNLLQRGIKHVQNEHHAVCNLKY